MNGRDRSPTKKLPVTCLLTLKLKEREKDRNGAIEMCCCCITVFTHGSVKKEMEVKETIFESQSKDKTYELLYPGDINFTINRAGLRI